MSFRSELIVYLLEGRDGTVVEGCRRFGVIFESAGTFAGLRFHFGLGGFLLVNMSQCEVRRAANTCAA